MDSLIVTVNIYPVYYRLFLYIWLKYMNMRTSKFSKEDKLNILFEQYESDMSVEAICAKYEISTPTFYNWKRELSKITELDVHSHNLQELQGENNTLRKLYIDLSEHNYKLAKFLNNQAQ